MIPDNFSDICAHMRVTGEENMLNLADLQKPEAMKRCLGAEVPALLSELNQMM